MRPTNLPKPLRTGGLALAALVLVGAGVIYTLDDGSAPAPRVELASARRGTVTAEVSAAGNTVEDSTRELAFGGSGTVTKVYVKAGDKVGRGEVLARIGSAPARERYAAAKAQLSAAREALDGAQDAATSQTSQTSQAQPQVQSQARTQGQQTQGQQTQQQAGQQGTSGDPARQAACVPTATPGASARPTAAPGPSGTAGRRGTPGPDGTAGPGGTGGPTGSPGPGRTSAPATAERPVAVAPAGGIAPAGYFLRPAGYFLGPARTPAPVSALSRARAETPAPTPTPEPTATPTPAPTPTEGSPEPAPTVTVTVTAAPTVTVTATATVTVTATPTVGRPPANTGPTGSGPTARPSEHPEPGPSARPTSTTTAEPGASPTPTVGRTPGPRDTACPRQSPTQGADRRSGEDGGTGRTDTGGTGTGTGGQRALSVDQAEAEVKRAEADLTDAREELAGVRIVAPADGTVLSVAGAVGDSVGTGAFVTLGDLDELQVEALFTESDIGELKLGQRASITLATREGDEHTGTVTRIAPTATTTDRLVRYGVAVAFDKAPKGLMVGQTATVTVTVAESEQALYLPAQAVRSKAGGGSVVTVQGGVERAVRTGVRSDRYIEITAGLRENERVVLPGGTVTGGFPDSSWPAGA